MIMETREMKRLVSRWDREATSRALLVICFEACRHETTIYGGTMARAKMFCPLFPVFVPPPLLFSISRTDSVLWNILLAPATSRSSFERKLSYLNRLPKKKKASLMSNVELHWHKNILFLWKNKYTLYDRENKSLRQEHDGRRYTTRTIIFLNQRDRIPFEKFVYHSVFFYLPADWRHLRRDSVIPSEGFLRLLF